MKFFLQKKFGRFVCVAAGPKRKTRAVMSVLGVILFLSLVTTFATTSALNSSSSSVTTYQASQAKNIPQSSSSTETCRTFHHGDDYYRMCVVHTKKTITTTVPASTNTATTLETVTQTVPGSTDTVTTTATSPTTTTETSTTTEISTTTETSLETSTASTTTTVTSTTTETDTSITIPTGPVNAPAHTTTAKLTNGDGDSHCTYTTRNGNEYITCTRTVASTTTKTVTASPVTTTLIGTTTTTQSLPPTTTTLSVTETSTSTETTTETQSSTTTTTTSSTTTATSTETDYTTTTSTTTTTIYTTGGGGCVLSGTLVTLGNGTQTPVQNLGIGDRVLSYDLQANKMIVENVTSNNSTLVNQIVDINNGELYASGLSDQPLWIMRSNGTTGWVFLGQLQVGMKIFEPVANTWISIQSLSTTTGSYLVYDLRISGFPNNNYIANNLLVDDKVR